jgi:hypothetical protein
MSTNSNSERSKSSTEGNEVPSRGAGGRKRGPKGVGCLGGPTPKDHVSRRCRVCRAERSRRARGTPAGKRALNEYNAKIKGGRAYKAKAVVYVAVRAGRLPRAIELFCIDCDGPAQVYDHRDYSKPLDVEPVCRSCNAKRGPAK